MTVLSPVAAATLSTETGEISMGSSDPNITLHLDATDVSGISLLSGYGVYDLKLTDSSGTIILVLRGDVNLYDTVTN